MDGDADEAASGYCDHCGRDLPREEVDEVTYQPFHVCHECIDSRRQLQDPKDSSGSDRGGDGP